MQLDRFRDGRAAQAVDARRWALRNREAGKARRAGQTGRGRAVASMAGAGAAVGVMSEAIAFDNHRFVKNLTAGGLAEAPTDEQPHLLICNLATEAELEFEIERVRSELEVGTGQVGAEGQQARADVLKRATDAGGISLGEVD